MIDKTEFRGLLRLLKLTYSDDRFKRLFRVINTSGNGCITFDELKQLVHHLDDEEDEAAREEEARRKEVMSQSHLKSRMTKMGSFPNSRRSSSESSSPPGRPSQSTIAEMKTGREDLHRTPLQTIPSSRRLDDDSDGSHSDSSDDSSCHSKSKSKRNVANDMVVTEAEDV